MSTVGTPGYTISSVVSTVNRPGEVVSAPTRVLPRNLTPIKRATLFGLSAIPTPGSPLQPHLVGARGPNGELLGFRHGAPFAPVVHREALAYALASRPGLLAAQLTGLKNTTGSAVVSNYLPGDINGDGQVNYDDMHLYEKAYLSKVGDPNYIPSADANRNGQIGIGDGKFLLRNFPPLTPKKPQVVHITLAPGDQVINPGPTSSGGVTTKLHVTELGHTTPGSLVFEDSGLGDYTFTGRVQVADANGNFAFTIDLDPEDQLKNTEYLVIDPYGQQTYRAFPILYIGPSK